jgi:transmembrane sensor
MMNDEEFLRLLDRYTKGECTPEEKQYFETFFNAAQKNKDWAAWEESSRNRIGQEIFQSIEQTLEKEERRWLAFVPVMRVAASIAVIVSIAWAILLLVNRHPQGNYMTEVTGPGQRATLTLSDGSVVTLNAGSVLTFPERFTGDRRKVTLHGEAFFDIKRNPEKPFVIATPTLETLVLGTSFNIRAYDAETHAAVTVKTGTVKVSSRNNHTVVLKPEEQAYFDNTTALLEKRNVSSGNFLAWTSEILYLDNTPMREVVETLEQWYNIQILLENDQLGNCPISGKYKNDRLLNMLEGLKFSQGIDYHFVAGNKIIITGKTCTTQPTKPQL